ncbi:MAG TPA: hypothetical protein VIL34_04150 [Actinopolymorphaceae bacterium]|jgi:hypothetical protein
MSFLTRIRELIRKDQKARRLGERDAPADIGTARTRAEGGVPQSSAPDRHSTTGTTPSETFVGRVGGNESDTGTTGAEVRAEAERRRTEKSPDDSEPNE